MKKASFTIGILSILIAIIVFVFAEGSRRIYSGVFFTILGIVLLGNGIYWSRKWGKSKS